MTDNTSEAEIAIVLLADTDTPEAMGRMSNALTTAKDFKDAGDEVKVIFDGAGTRWAAAHGPFRGAQARQAARSGP